MFLIYYITGNGRAMLVSTSFLFNIVYSGGSYPFLRKNTFL